jgi:hypothetical protein
VIFIQSHLSQTFPISGWQWIVRALSDNKFLVEPSSKDWRKKALLNGQIWLGGVYFSIELFHLFKYDGEKSQLRFGYLLLVYHNIFGKMLKLVG